VTFVVHSVNRYSYDYTILNAGLCRLLKGKLYRQIDKATPSDRTTLGYEKAKY
jgi:hypothetical protein